MSTNQHLLIRRSIQIVCIALTCNKRVKLLNHQAQCIEFVFKLGAVDKQNTLKQKSTNINVAHILSNSFEHGPESWTQIGQTLLLGIQS